MFERNKNEKTLEACFKEIEELKLAVQECKRQCLTDDEIRKINDAIDTNSISIAYLSKTITTMTEVYQAISVKLKTFEEQLLLTGTKFKDYSN